MRSGAHVSRNWQMRTRKVLTTLARGKTNSPNCLTSTASTTPFSGQACPPPFLRCGIHCTRKIPPTLTPTARRALLMFNLRNNTRPNPPPWIY